MGVLDGKVAVITGSSHGLGLAIAEAFAREGAAVVLTARSNDSLGSYRTLSSRVVAISSNRRRERRSPSRSSIGRARSSCV